MIPHLILCRSVAAWRDATGLSFHALRVINARPSRSLSRYFAGGLEFTQRFAGLLPG